MIVSLTSHLWLETSEFMIYALIRFVCLAKITNGKDATYSVHIVLARNMHSAQEHCSINLHYGNSIIHRILDA